MHISLRGGKPPRILSAAKRSYARQFSHALIASTSISCALGHTMSGKLAVLLGSQRHPVGDYDLPGYVNPAHDFFSPFYQYSGIGIGGEINDSQNLPKM
jgi:hypothetical protein